VSARGLFVQIHVVLSCGVILFWLAALAAYVGPWRRYHMLIGRIFLVLVVASTVSAVGLASDARDRFGALFVMQPLVLCLSAGAQFHRSRWVVRALGGVGLLVSVGVLHGFARMLATRGVIDVIAFAWAALTLAVLAVDDLRKVPRPRWRAHGHRMLAVGWFYVAELGIFVFDPHPSVVYWAAASIMPVIGVWWMRRQPRNLSPVGRAMTGAVASDAG
jgi:hypothetical protein